MSETFPEDKFIPSGLAKISYDEAFIVSQIHLFYDARCTLQTQDAL